MQTSNKKAENNVRFYATELIVNCTGCDIGGPHNYKELTEEKVKEVENIAERLRTWWNGHNWRKQHPVP